MLREVQPPFVSLVECRRVSEPIGGDALVLDVEVERGQAPPIDIHPSECIAVIFWDDDDYYPEVLALRADFPQVPHVNMRTEEFPRSLCLYEEPWAEAKLGWTPRNYIERIRRWLADTAEDRLHRPDQPLELIVEHSLISLVIPAELMDGETTSVPDSLQIFRAGPTGPHTTLVAVPRSEQSDQEGATNAPEFLAMVVRSAPQVHGVIRRLPQDLRDLHSMLSGAGVDLLETIRQNIRAWKSAGETMEHGLALLIHLPKTRHARGPIESTDVRAFICFDGEKRASILSIGQAIGLWDITEGQPGFLLKVDDSREGSEIGLLCLNTLPAFTRRTAARLSGTEPVDMKIVTIGMGALGSQAFLNLVRCGWGDWTVVDRDYLLPHNAARHALPGSFIGSAKAMAMAVVADSTIAGKPIAKCIVADVLRPGAQADELSLAYQESELILDTSASVTVGRFLAHDIPATARRASLFLNPSGTDLVLLTEDVGRAVKLDALEAQYYRTVATDERLSGHLQDPHGRLRYGQSCADITSEISQEFIGLHAAIGSRAMRQAAGQPGPCIVLWLADPSDLSVTRIAPPVYPVVSQQTGDWLLVTDAYVVEKVQRLREEALPNETGGVLIGLFDMQRKIAYVVDALASPPDSTASPTSYIRGAQGLQSTVSKISDLTAGMLHFAGEWHSHPKGHGAIPSGLDRRAFQRLAAQREVDGYPALMLIVGDETALGWYLDALPPSDAALA